MIKFANEAARRIFNTLHLHDQNLSNSVSNQSIFSKLSFSNGDDHNEQHVLEDSVPLQSIIDKQKVDQQYSIYKVRRQIPNANEDGFIQVITQQLQVLGQDMTAVSINDMTDYVKNMDLTAKVA